MIFVGSHQESGADILLKPSYDDGRTHFDGAGIAFIKFATITHQYR